MTNSTNPPGLPDDVQGVTLSRSEVLALVEIAEVDDPETAPSAAALRDKVPDHPMVGIKTQVVGHGRVVLWVQIGEDADNVTSFTISPHVWRFLRSREAEFNR